MAFTAKDVQALREMTGVGMMDCKKALVASDGNIDKAIEFLREKGLAAAQKKAGRIAAEGIVGSIVEDGVGAIVEVNSETDFVAKNDSFVKFVNDIASVIAKENPKDIEALFACKYPGSDQTVEQMQQEKVLVIGENIKIRRFARYDTGVSVPYVHMGGRIGVLVNMDVSENIASKPEVTELGKDICMQIAAMNPTYLDSDAISEEEKAHERGILMAQTIAEGKPENVAEKIVDGRLNKYFQEICLLNQAFVKESKISVAQHVANVAKELGGEITVKGFVRYEKGEGIEKKVDDFAAEVAAAAGTNK